MSVGLVFRIKQWVHTPIIKTSRLGEMDNSESVDYSCLGISDLEVVPLGVFICEQVRAHSHLVFIFCPKTQKKEGEKKHIKMTFKFKLNNKSNNKYTNNKLPIHRKLFIWETTFI